MVISDLSNVTRGHAVFTCCLCQVHHDTNCGQGRDGRGAAAGGAHHYPVQPLVQWLVTPTYTLKRVLIAYIEIKLVKYHWHQLAI